MDFFSGCFSTAANDLQLYNYKSIQEHSSHILAVMLACDKDKLHTFPLFLLWIKKCHKSVLCSLDLSEFWQESCRSLEIEIAPIYYESYSESSCPVVLWMSSQHAIETIAYTIMWCLCWSFILSCRVRKPQLLARTRRSAIEVKGQRQRSCI